MTEPLGIRLSTIDDHARIEAIYPLAFPEEALLPLVRDLLANPDVALSLVGEIGGDIVGHIVFTRCDIDGDTALAALLGPLAVTPSHHGRGVGSALIRAGLEKLRDDGVDVVMVLGDPAFYGRLGFEADARVEPPYPLPAEWSSAWQSRTLGDGPSTSAGKLQVPAPWHDPALWSD
jgi:putative acetyltransferase